MLPSFLPLKIRVSSRICKRERERERERESDSGVEGEICEREILL
jgi:hypothetical protein